MDVYEGVGDGHFGAVINTGVNDGDGKDWFKTSERGSYVYQERRL